MKLNKEDREMIVKNSKAVLRDSERAKKVFEKGIKQANVDIATAEVLIKKFG